MVGAPRFEHPQVTSRIELTIKVDGRVVRCDIAAKSLRKARATIAAHGAANVVTIVQGKLTAGDVLTEVGLVGAAEDAQSARRGGVIQSCPMRQKSESGRRDCRFTSNSHLHQEMHQNPVSSGFSSLKPDPQKFKMWLYCSGFLMVPDEGIEPPTFGLQNRCSTAELIRHFNGLA